MNVLIPIKTISETNQREHWGSRQKRRKAQREAAYLAVKRHSLPCVVVLTRIAPRRMDSDNLQGALKGVRDGIADRLGVDDADHRVSWLYGQEKGDPKQYAVRVEIGEPPAG